MGRVNDQSEEAMDDDDECNLRLLAPEHAMFPNRWRFCPDLARNPIFRCEAEQYVLVTASELNNWPV